MHILLIDDDHDLTAILSQYLRHEGFEVSEVQDGSSAIAQLKQRPYALAVLDIMMSGINGLATLQQIRQFSAVPVLMLTARGDDLDKVMGLNLGADDYVAKPCTPAELVARVRAILRRTPSLQSTDPSRPLQLSPGKRQALWYGKPLELTGNEFVLLEALARQAGNLVSKEDISLAAFNRPLTRFDRRIDVHISVIRQKLGPRPDGQAWIQNVRGLGYQFLEAE